MKKLKIYLDTCCYNRPFDDQSDEKIHIETEAIMTIFKLNDDNRVIIIGSEIIDFEIDNIIDLEKRMKVSNIVEITEEKIYIDDEIGKRAKHLESLGFTAYDALHLAASENHKADFFVTTDIKLLKKSKLNKSRLFIDVYNPIELIKEIFYG